MPSIDLLHPGDSAEGDATLSGRSLLEPVVQESTPSMIARRVRDAIGHGEFAPGSQVSEAALAKRLGVSRGPLREGLQRLTQEGLLIGIRNRGLFVLEMTPDNVRDMYVAREAVERAAGVQVHVHDPAAAGAELHLVCERMAQAARRNDIPAVSEADLTFHKRLVAASRSSRLTRIHETLLTETRMCLHALEATYGPQESRVEEHRAIAESFAAGDPDRTDRLIVEHMRDALRRLT